MTSSTATTAYGTLPKLSAPVINSITSWDYRYATFNITNPNSLAVTVSAYLACGGGCEGEEGTVTTKTIAANSTANISYDLLTDIGFTLCEDDLVYKISFEKNGYTASNIIEGRVDYETFEFTISYPAKPTGVSGFYIYKNGTRIVTNPTAAGTFRAIYGDRLYAETHAAIGYGAPTITGISTNSSSPTIADLYKTITLTAGTKATSLSAPIISDPVIYEEESDGDWYQYFECVVENDNDVPVTLHYTITNEDGDVLESADTYRVEGRSTFNVACDTDYADTITMTCYFTANNVTSATTTYTSGGIIDRQPANEPSTFYGPDQEEIRLYGYPDEITFELRSGAETSAYYDWNGQNQQTGFNSIFDYGDLYDYNGSELRIYYADYGQVSAYNGEDQFIQAGEKPVFKFRLQDGYWEQLEP